MADCIYVYLCLKSITENNYFALSSLVKNFHRAIENLYKYWFSCSFISRDVVTEPRSKTNKQKITKYLTLFVREVQKCSPGILLEVTLLALLLKRLKFNSGAKPFDFHQKAFDVHKIRQRNCLLCSRS